jgi:hypothetical protein
MASVTMTRAGVSEIPTSIIVPDDLAELPRWGCWRLEDSRKVPYTTTTGRRASSVNRDDWGELEAAREVLRSGRYSGLAFCFFEADGFVGIDCDDCLTETGEVKPKFRPFLERFSDTYCETSPSRKGLKLWVRGALPSALKAPVGDGGIELYSRGRYFAFTGARFRQAPLEVADHAEDIRALYEHLTAGKPRGWPLQPLEGGKVRYGEQHNFMVSLAGTLRVRRVCDAAILACLLEVNRSQLERPGPVANIERIVRSTRNWGQAS